MLVEINTVQYVCEKTISSDGIKNQPKYLRVPINSQIIIKKEDLEKISNNSMTREVIFNKKKTNLIFVLTKRMVESKNEKALIFTFTLLNKEVMEKNKNVKNEDCMGKIKDLQIKISEAEKKIKN